MSLMEETISILCSLTCYQAEPKQLFSIVKTYVEKQKQMYKPNLLWAFLSSATHSVRTVGGVGHLMLFP